VHVHQKSHSTGSTAAWKTIGTVVVAAFAACTEAVPPIAANVHLTANQIGRQGWKSIVLPLRPAIFDRDVLALDIAAFAQMG
jgi:hypothetical protein